MLMKDINLTDRSARLFRRIPSIRYESEGMI